MIMKQDRRTIVATNQAEGVFIRYEMECETGKNPTTVTGSMSAYPDMSAPRIGYFDVSSNGKSNITFLDNSLNANLKKTLVSAIIDDCDNAFNGVINVESERMLEQPEGQTV